MTITTAKLTKAAGLAAVVGGLLYIGVQIMHPDLDLALLSTTEWKVRQMMKVLFAALSLAGITGMYLRQVKQTGVLGLVGYLLLSVGYLAILGTVFTAAFVLPSLVGTDPAYVNDVAVAANGGHPAGDIGLLEQVIQVQGAGYLLGGLLFGIALYRARVLARWAAALLAVGGLVSAALMVMPDAFYRLLAFPNGIAMIGLGCSLWLSSRPTTTTRRLADPELRSTAGVG